MTSTSPTGIFTMVKLLLNKTLITRYQLCSLITLSHSILPQIVIFLPDYTKMKKDSLQRTMLKNLDSLLRFLIADVNVEFNKELDYFEISFKYDFHQYCFYIETNDGTTGNILDFTLDEKDVQYQSDDFAIGGQEK